MSYSFRIQAATKDQLKAEAAAKVAQVVEQHPAHAADAEHILAAIDKLVDLTVQLPDNDIYASVGGYIAHNAEHQVTGISSSVTTGNTPRSA